MSNDAYQEALRELTRRVFDSAEPSPHEDVVDRDRSRHSLTIDDLDRFNTTSDTWVANVPEPEIVADADGFPAGTTNPGPVPTHRGVVVTKGELDRLGVDLDEARRRWPNVAFVDLDLGDGRERHDDDF